MKQHKPLPIIQIQVYRGIIAQVSATEAMMVEIVDRDNTSEPPETRAYTPTPLGLIAAGRIRRRWGDYFNEQYENCEA